VMTTRALLFLRCNIGMPGGAVKGESHGMDRRDRFR